MSDLAIIDPGAAIEAASDPSEFVVQCLTRGKSWLTEALAHGDLEAIAEVKGWAATLRTATMQKQLGKDAELAATELVRRAERAIGLGIRAGQEAGEVATVGYRGKPLAPYTRVRNGVEEHIQPQSREPITTLTSPSELVAHPDERSAIYAMTDDVTDEEFEQAITEAKDEGNLSRANVTRKLKPEKAKPKPKDRDEFHARTRRINPERIIDETISTLEGLAMGLALVEADHYAALDAEKRLEWLEALRQPLAAINRMKKGLQQ